MSARDVQRDRAAQGRAASGRPARSRPRDLPDPARRRAGLDDGPRPPGRDRQPALDVRARHRLGGRLPRLRRPDARPTTCTAGCDRRPRSATRSTGSTSTTATPATSSAAATRARPRTSTRRCRRGAPAAPSGSGFLPAAQHVHEVNPPQGFFVSWNNKPAPGFAAADDQYGVRADLPLGDAGRPAEARSSRATRDRVTRADVVQAMETAASQDLDGARGHCRCCCATSPGRTDRPASRRC